MRGGPGSWHEVSTPCMGHVPQALTMGVAVLRFDWSAEAERAAEAHREGGWGGGANANGGAEGSGSMADDLEGVPLKSERATELSTSSGGRFARENAENDGGGPLAAA